MTGRPADVFRANVKLIIADRGMSITELAAASGTSRPGLSRILAAKDGVTLDRADRIAQALKIPLRELLSENLENVLSSA